MTPFPMGFQQKADINWRHFGLKKGKSDCYAYLGQRHSPRNRISFLNKLLKHIELFLYTY